MPSELKKMQLKEILYRTRYKLQSPVFSSDSHNIPYESYTTTVCSAGELIPDGFHINL